jgi:hypothetical protein
VPLSSAKILLNKVEQSPNVAKLQAQVVLDIVHVSQHCLLQLTILVMVLKQLLDVQNNPKQLCMQHILGLGQPAEQVCEVVADIADCCCNDVHLGIVGVSKLFAARQSWYLCEGNLHSLMCTVDS